MTLEVSVDSIRRSVRRSLGLPAQVKVARGGVVTTWNLNWRTHNLLHVSRFSLSEPGWYVNDTVNVSDPHVTIVE
jgi:hypothetical protein